MIWSLSSTSSVITIAAWVLFMRLWRAKFWKSPGSMSLLAVTVNAVYAAYLSVYVALCFAYPSPPPWRNPQILNFGLLSLSVPLAMFIGAFAGVRGVSGWLVLLLELASLPLLFLGLMAGAAA